MEELVNSYIRWIKEGMTLQDIGSGWFELVTPFLNHKNDKIELYLSRTSNGVMLTDGGNTINELALSGVDINKSRKRIEELNSILRSFGISIEKGELFVRTDDRKFPEVKHRLIQAILAIDDMFMLSSPKVESFFLEDVADFFELNEVIYVKDVTLNGKSGFNHKFDFTLPRIKERKETAIKAINTPRKDRIGEVIWTIEDIRLARPETNGMVIINDRNEMPDDVAQALEEYKIPYFTWSARMENIKRLRVA